MTKAYEFNWMRTVPEQLQNGSMFDIFFEEKIEIIFESCLFKVDEFGFFIYWKPANRESMVLELCQVNDIRIGSLPKDNRIVQELQLRVQSKGTNAALEDLLLTICYGTDLVNIEYTYCLCESAEIAKIWQNGLRNITNNNKANNLCPSTCLKKHHMKLLFLVDAQGKIPVKSIAKTFASGKAEKLIYQYMKEVGLPHEKNDVIEPAHWTFDKFYDLTHKICPRTDIEDLFNSIARGDADYINTRQLIDFLNDKQRDPRLNEILYPLYDEKRAREIMRTYEPDAELAAQGRISKEGLTRYLMSDENAPVFLDRLDIYMDMDQPLSHYYINSSHNTYLTGRQFGGRSSVEMYRQVLLAGCRCIELDCWDGKSEEEPIITHGKAMCTDIQFKEVIIAIRDCAFVTSEYPVILSFENHCSKKQQYKMAKYCDEILGDLLLKEPLSNYPLEPGIPLPSPNDLKRKIIIKNKKLRRDTEKVEYDLWLKGQLQSRADYEIKEDPTILIVENNSLINVQASTSSASPTQKTPTVQITSANLLEASSSMQSPSKSSTKQQLAQTVGQIAPEQIALQNYHYIGATTYVHPWLSSMINYTQSVKFINFVESENANKHYHMSSFAETAALNLLKSQAIEFVNYNKRQLSRIYPKGTRAESSNFLPQIFWNAGCQMVALNFQTCDLAMQLNQGKFEYNGNCGYLLKPDFMRRKDRVFDPFSESPVDGVIAAQCSVRVISGQFLSDRKVSTYVEVDMFGLPTDTIRKEFRTRMVPANGLNPIYNEEAFVFRKVVLPDLAVLRIAVYDENSKMLGQRILPLDGLQTGYRHISLRTEGNFPMSLPMLFICIELKIYVPDGLGDLIDALSDPRAFLSNQEKRRLQQMKAMGVEDTDLGSTIMGGPNNAMVTGGISLSGSSQQAIALDAVGLYVSGNMCEFEQSKFCDITIGALKQDKKFLKLRKKQESKLQELIKEQQEEKQKLLKKQCQQMEKYLKQNNYSLATLSQTKQLVKRKLAEQPNSCSSTQTLSMFSRPPSSQDESQANNHTVVANNVNSTAGTSTGTSVGTSSSANNHTATLNVESIAKDEQIEKIVNEQIKDWSVLLDKQKKIEHNLCRHQVEKQNEKIRKLMLREQAKQIKKIDFLFAKQIKEMKNRQAKISVDTYKEVIGDKTLRNKMERDRRLREKKCNNTKKFIEERRTAAIVHSKEMDRLKKMHNTQLMELDRYSKHAIESFNGAEVEYKLFSKKKCFC